MKQTIDKVNELIEYYDLKVPNKKQDLVYKRCYLMHHLKKNTGLSLADIGLMFSKVLKNGDGDHATVLYGIRKHLNIKDTETYKFHTESLEDKLYITRRVSKEVESTIIEEVLLCKNYWEMVKLQNKYKNITQLE